MMEVTGKIKLIKETEVVGATFKKRGLVVETNEQYPQMIMVEFVQDKCELLDTYSVGNDVKVSINLRGREWINPEGFAKYFNSVQGWRIEKVEGESIPQGQPVAQISSAEPQDLPF